MTIYGPSGRPILQVGGPKVEVRDTAVTYAKDGESYTAEADQLLMAMARRKRDGATNRQIIAEFDLAGRAVHNDVLNRALRVGMTMLDEAIAEGREPAETHQLRIVEDDDDGGS